jgi:CRISPR/Cas system CSM-associated protein Csm3 (group 7 of RAMP superfamily)
MYFAGAVLQGPHPPKATHMRSQAGPRGRANSIVGFPFVPGAALKGSLRRPAATLDRRWSQVPTSHERFWSP